MLLPLFSVSRGLHTKDVNAKIAIFVIKPTTSEVFFLFFFLFISFLGIQLPLYFHEHETLTYHQKVKKDNTVNKKYGTELSLHMKVFMFFFILGLQIIIYLLCSYFKCSMVKYPFFSPSNHESLMFVISHWNKHKPLSMR